MIKIFYCNSDDLNIPKSISKHRLEKIQAANHDNFGMINSAKVLHAGFASYGINEADVVYALGKHGKPHAADFPSIHFSLSHSENMAIIAFYNKKIGLDCEKSNKKISMEIINRFFSPKEATDFSGKELLLWCAKEATVKYTGNGFALGRHEYTIPLFEREIAFNGIWLKRLDIEGYTCVICTESPDDIKITKL